MPVSAAQRARLAAAHERGETPTSRRSGLALYVAGIKVVDTEGFKTDAGRLWEAELGGRIPSRFQNIQRNRRTGHEFVVENGKTTYLRKWNPAAEEWNLTKAGRAHYREQARFIVRVPVTGHNGERTWSTTRDGRPLTLPIDSKAIYTRFARLREMGNVRAHQSEEAMKQFIRDAVVEYIRSFAHDKEAFDRGDEDVVIADYNQSDVYYTFDAVRAQNLDGFTFSLELERYHRVAPPTTEVILNRPLRAFIEAPPDMWNKHHIVEEAWTSGETNCVLQQLLVIFRKRKRTGNSRDGTQEESKEPQFHPRALEVLIDQLVAKHHGVGSPTYEATTEREQELLAEYRTLVEAKHLKWGDCRSFDELRQMMRKNGNRDYDGLTDALTEAYGGNRSDGAKRYKAFFDRFFHPVMHQGALHYVRRLDFDVGPQIAAPYEEGDWRQVGVTSNIVVEMCRLLERPCKVVFGESCIFEFVPPSWKTGDPNASRDHKMVVWNIRGNHAFFYDLPDHGCKLEVKQLTEQPRVRVRPNPLDMDEQVAFEEMEQWCERDFLKAFEERTPTVFWTADLEAAESVLNRLNIGHKLRFRGDDLASLRVPCGEQQKKAKGREGIVIRRVPADWWRLQKILQNYVFRGDELRRADHECRQLAVDLDRELDVEPDFDADRNALMASSPARITAGDCERCRACLHRYHEDRFRDCPGNYHFRSAEGGYRVVCDQCHQTQTSEMRRQLHETQPACACGKEPSMVHRAEGGFERVCGECHETRLAKLRAGMLIAKSDQLKYCGEDEGALMLRIFQDYTKAHRVPLTERERTEIAEAQQRRCGQCGDEVDFFEIHHRKPVAEGGTNARENLTLLCLPCHRSHTDQQLTSGGYVDYCSVLNPEMMKIFEDMPKPKQGAWGVDLAVEDGEGKPHRPKDVACLDVTACRVTAVSTRETLPSFLFQDAPEPVGLTSEGQLREALHNYDFYYIDLDLDMDPECRHERVHYICKHCGECHTPCPHAPTDLARTMCVDCMGSGLSTEALGVYPYRGPQWVPLDLVEYLMWRQILRPEHIKWGVKASVQRRVKTEADPSGFRRQPRDLHHFLHEVVPGLTTSDDPFEEKRLRLALLGVFGRTDDIEWIGTRTAHEEDVGPFDQKVFDRPGPPLCRFAVKCRSPRSYLPIAHIILWREQIYVTEARRHMRSLPRQLTIVGELVDGVYFIPHDRSSAAGGARPSRRALAPSVARRPLRGPGARAGLQPPHDRQGLQAHPA